MSIFDSREKLQEAIDSGKDQNGFALSSDAIDDLKATLAHQSFDEMSIGGRQSYFNQLRRTRSYSSTGGGDTGTALGWIMVIAGVLAVLGSLAMKVSVSSATDSRFIGDTYIPATTSDVINIGLLQNQMMVFEAGLALALGGIVVLGAAMVRNAITSASKNHVDD